MIETPESEPREVLDAFAEAMKSIRKEIDDDPTRLTGAPHTRPVGRMDEVQAAKRLDVNYQKK
ncbi:MAG: hypothetical protein MPW13_00570 [Candidatus Manganitrophus sp.]|nr:hypothetical protein [Candidatus Manganitrophus sp.]